MQMRELDVGYNTADKNLGAVVYSKDLFKEQCLLHLEDSKGTYRKIEDQTKEDILKLRLVLLPFKKHGLGWANIAESIIRDSKNALNKGKLCNFYVI